MRSPLFKTFIHQMVHLPLQIVFKTDIYGTFRQQVVLGFGLDTVVVRDVQVESCPATDPEKLTKDLELSAAGRWTPESVTIVPFLPPWVSAKHSVCESWITEALSSLESFRFISTINHYPWSSGFLTKIMKTCTVLKAFGCWSPHCSCLG